MYLLEKTHLRIYQLKKVNKLFSSKIKLPVGLGDWTVIDPGIGFMDDFEISSVETASFDSFSKKDLKQIHFMHHSFADLLSKHLSNDLDIKIDYILL